MIQSVVFVFSSVFLQFSWSGCPFQNPFFFIDRPSVVTVSDTEGEMVANRVRVSWGEVENFKCVDYFQIEYYEQMDQIGSVKQSGKINRHRHSHDIDIKPCTDYIFKVIASEDWKGMREDFRIESDMISFRVDYTPKFKKLLVVKERRVRVQRPRRRRLIEDEGKSPTTIQSESEPPFNVWVSWKTSDIDWPMCLDYLEFDYYDTVYNESTIVHTVQPPFYQRMEFELGSQEIPCNVEYSFIARVYGLTGDHSIEVWTPPSCTLTTPRPAITTPIPPTTLKEEGTLLKALQENVALKERITGLKQQYSPIGTRVYESLKASIFHSFESYLARKKILEGGDIGKLQFLAENPDDPFSVL